jgi:uncharacterized SAM-binding protein YcdF (DUF218 family)
MATNEDWRRNLRGRRRQALFGAAAGVLAATSFVMADIPLIHGEHSIALIVLGALGGAAVGLFDVWGFAGWTAVVLALATVLIALTPMTSGLVEPWVRADPMPERPLDAIVVLSADVNRAGVLNVQGVERLISGVKLLRAGRAPLIVTTRIVNADGGPPITSDADQRSLIELGSDTSHWRVVPRVRSTREEALRVSELLKPAASHTIGLVTSPMHTRRACATFEAVGFHVVCIPSESRYYPIHALYRPMSRFHAFFDWGYERLGMIEYRSRGWIRS